jgi:outer membrane murein-binding lipoprotein Lpp
MPAVSPIRRNTPSMLIAVVVLAVLFVGAIAGVLFFNADRGKMVGENKALTKKAEELTTDVARLTDEAAKLKAFVGQDTKATLTNVQNNLYANLKDKYLMPIPTWDQNAAMSVSTISQQLQQNPSTDTVLGQLRGWVNDASTRIDDLNKKVTTLEGDKQSLQRQVDAVKQEKETLNTNLTAQITSLEQSKQDLQTKLTKDYQDLEKNLRDEIKKGDDNVRSLERQVKAQQMKIQDQDSLIAKLRQDIADLTKPPTPTGEGIADGGPPAVTPGAQFQADGKIISAEPQRDLVYIDIGSKDHLPLGIQFRVYSATETNLDPLNEGKGLIEVTKVFLTLAECRIVKKGEGEMVKGDLVVNPVYKRGQQMKFFVFGSFDLDGDGQPDPRGTERIAQLIRNWGGQVVDKISVDTDYGVMGMEPELPARPAPDADPITEQQYNKKKAAYDEYKQQLAQLRSYTIPVLNQNRFLSLIGYYEQQATAPATGAP